MKKPPRLASRHVGEMVSPLIGAVAGGETQDGKSNTAFAENMRVLHLQREYARAQEQLALPHARADDEAFEIDATNLDVLIGWNHPSPQPKARWGGSRNR